MDELESLRWIPAPIAIECELESVGATGFAKEFDRMAESDEDPVGQWLKLARARGETKESDPVVLQLLVELHRKIDTLSAKLQGDEGARLHLGIQSAIEGVNFTHFLLEKPLLVPHERYYGRLSIPVFPQRDVALYFDALSDRVGRLAILHERDQRSWDGYVASRERVMIRQLKAKNDS